MRGWRLPTGVFAIGYNQNSSKETSMINATFRSFIVDRVFDVILIVFDPYDIYCLYMYYEFHIMGSSKICFTSTDPCILHQANKFGD
jgi:hypothetical protein